MSKRIEQVARGFEDLNPGLFRRHEFKTAEAEAITYSNYSYWRSTWKAFIKHKIAVFLLCLIAVLLLFTVIQPMLPDQKDPNYININAETGYQDLNVQPCKEYWFGTNSIGQDLWARIWAGTRTSLLIGILVGVINCVMGIIVGAIWGYVRKLDFIITEIYNIINNIPTTILLILLTYIMRPSIQTMVMAMCCTGWLSTARYIRNQVIIIRDREYNLASRCLGTGTKKIITKNLLPYLISVIMMQLALSIPGTIGWEVFLTYIGLGLPLETPSLGNLVNEGRVLMQSPALSYQLWFPAAVLSIITISFYVLGNVFADAADPRNHM